MIESGLLRLDSREGCGFDYYYLKQREEKTEKGTNRTELIE